MLRSPILLAPVLASMLALSACGSSGKQVDTASYTCADFNKSLRTKDDNTAGQFINKLRDQASLNQDKDTEQRELTLAIYFTCRGSPGTTRPAAKAIATAKLMKAGKFTVPGAAKKKKSGQ